MDTENPTRGRRVLNGSIGVLRIGTPSLLVYLLWELSKITDKLDKIIELLLRSPGLGR